MTQERLAEAFDMTTGGMQKWLAGTRQPSLEEIDGIAKLLGVPGSYLTHGITPEDLCSDLPDPARRVLRQLVAAQRDGQASPALWSAIEQVMDLAGIGKAPAKPLGAPIAQEHEKQLRERLEHGEREFERQQKPRRPATAN